MTRRPRRNHSPAFKPKVALAAVKGEKTLSQGDYYSRGKRCSNPCSVLAPNRKPTARPPLPHSKQRAAAS